MGQREESVPSVYRHVWTEQQRAAVLLPAMEQPSGQPGVRVLGAVLLRDAGGRDAGGRGEAHPGAQDVALGVLGLLPGRDINALFIGST